MTPEKIPPATSGRVSTREAAMTQRGRSSGRSTHAGVPYKSSGVKPSVSPKCCTMWALNNEWSDRSCSGPLSAANITTRAPAKAATWRRGASSPPQYT